MWKAAAGVGDTVSDWVGKGIEASGRQKRPSDVWKQGEIGFMSRDLGEGYAVSRAPDGKVSIVGPTGESLSLEQYQRLKGGAAVGGAPPAPAATQKVVPRTITEAEVQAAAQERKVDADVIRLRLKQQGHTLVP